MKGLGLLAVVAVGALLAAGSLLGEDGGTLRRPLAPREEAPERTRAGNERLIRSVLDARAAALSRGRAPARETATAAQARHDRLHAARARRMGVRSVRFDPRNLRIAGARASADVSIGYRVSGVRGRFTAQRRIRLRRRGDAWRVHSASGARRRPPWEVADFRRERSDHFVVLAPPAVEPAAGGLMAALETGYAQMRALVRGGELRRRYLVVVAGDEGQAQALTADIRGIERLAALTDTEVREDPGRARRVREVLSQRLIVVWPAFAAAGPEHGPTVVIHELTHAVLAPITSGRTPAWLSEGVALYVSDDLRAGEAGLSTVSLADLESPGAIARLSGEAQSAAYAYSSAVAFYIAERHGRQALLDLHEAFNDPRVRGQRHAVRKVLGVPLGRLERDLREWIALRAP